MAGRHPTLDDVLAARPVVERVASRTPTVPSRTFSRLTGAEVWLKAENLQRTGSFKVRGAAYRLSRLGAEQKRRGVVAASAGNHAQGVALAAHENGVPCTIVMPRHASLAKVQATRAYGALVVLEGESYDAAQEHARRLATENGLTLIHPFDDPDIIAGQGTLGLELAEDVAEVDAVAVPVGGGGLIAGVALAMKANQPHARVIGVQAQAAPGAALSFKEKRWTAVAPAPTVADGIAVALPGELPFALMRRYVDDVVTVSEEEITQAMVLLLERTKLLVEGAGAASVAALLSGRVPCAGKRVVAILSGGNVDLNLLSRTLDHGLAHAGRFMALRVVVLDRPGELSRLLSVLARQEVNVLDVSHLRRGLHLPMGQVVVELTAETRDAEHANGVARALEAAGYVRQEPQELTPPATMLSFVEREALREEA